MFYIIHIHLHVYIHICVWSYNIDIYAYICTHTYAAKGNHSSPDQCPGSILKM